LQDATIERLDLVLLRDNLVLENSISSTTTTTAVGQVSWALSHIIFTLTLRKGSKGTEVTESSNILK